MLWLFAGGYSLLGWEGVESYNRELKSELFSSQILTKQTCLLLLLHLLLLLLLITFFSASAFHFLCDQCLNRKIKMSLASSSGCIVRVGTTAPVESPSTGVGRRSSPVVLQFRVALAGSKCGNLSRVCRVRVGHRSGRRWSVRAIPVLQQPKNQIHGAVGNAAPTTTVEIPVSCYQVSCIFPHRACDFSFGIIVNSVGSYGGCIHGF